MRQADWFDRVHDGYSIVHLQHCDVIPEGGVCKVVSEPQHYVSGQRTVGGVAAVVLS